MSQYLYLGITGKLCIASRQLVARNELSQTVVAGNELSQSNL
jgi:hypothetical protein